MCREERVCDFQTVAPIWNCIGALVREAEQAESKRDFVHKLAIALKEANETEYWLDLLRETNYLDSAAFASIHSDVVELLKLLTSIIKTGKAMDN